jgi:predicted nucleotidyltransferase component of viral defense system
LQNVVLPPLEMDYINTYGVRTKVRVMDIREITAEKIRAMSDRIRYRDFYDFAMIMLELDIDLEEVLSLVGKKEIRSTISVGKILSNWELARQEKVNDFNSIYYTKELSDETIEGELKKLKFKDFIDKK